ncbi:plasmid replication initiator TrfA [Azotobacter chroococcum]|uniref:plasmid replication initiator TrfA n=1 Tax=Azotobacter chroococcum TaxID=353 RepID=UPI0010AEE2A3|nr:plasmid replication initiator TrfA [Azotobacter chroococcum]TKD45996.1 hypothetical protein FCG41_02950 [Azotobacter chroococcum]
MDKLKRMQERNVGGKEKEAEPSASAAEPVQQLAQVIRLPLWGEAMRGVPNGLLRSALFGAIAKGKRRFMKDEQIAAVEGVEISYTGERLDQGDLDVWESVLHLARSQSLGDECRVTSYALLKLMGKTDSGKNRATLRTRIIRLRANAVTIKQGRYSYIGGLVDEAYKDEETQVWVIVLNPKLHALYATDQFTQVDWSVRQALDGKPLAQWLHSFYASHAKPYPMRIETLLQLSGSENSELRSSRQKLRKALDAVIDACEALGQPFSYAVQGDLVHVERVPSGSQQKHLARPRKPRI